MTADQPIRIYPLPGETAPKVDWGVDTSQFWERRTRALQVIAVAGGSRRMRQWLAASHAPNDGGDPAPHHAMIELAHLALDQFGDPRE